MDGVLISLCAHAVRHRSVLHVPRISARRGHRKRCDLCHKVARFGLADDIALDEQLIIRQLRSRDTDAQICRRTAQRRQLFTADHFPLQNACFDGIIQL